MKVFLALCVLFALALSQVNAKCLVHCPHTDEAVWAVDGECIVFRNKCYYDRETCEGKSNAVITTKSECLQECNTNCPNVNRPVSGTYEGQTRTFRNACEKNAHACLTGETFI